MKKELINDLKIKGNKCLDIGDYYQGINYYTIALNYDSTPEIDILPLLSNRAEAFLKLGFFQSALNDCNQILEIDKDNCKAMFRKARALENLESDSTEFLEQAIELYDYLFEQFENDVPIKNNLIRKLKNAKIKLEFKKGKFNKFNPNKNIDNTIKITDLLEEENDMFELIIKSDYKYNTHSKEFRCSNYTSNKLFLSYDTNSGVYFTALEDIKEGELLLIEKPLVYIFAYEYEIFKFELIEEVEKEDNLQSEEIEDENYLIYLILMKKLQKRLNFASEKESVLSDLSCLYNGENLENNMKERKQNFINDKSEMKKIISSNSLLSIRNTHSYEYKDICFGLWVKSSFFNHSCVPNAFYFGVGPYLIIKSIKNIPKGDIINISYIEPKCYEKRQISLKKWNFTCKCELCLKEKEIAQSEQYIYILKKIAKLKNCLNNNYIMSYDDLNGLYNKDNIGDRKIRTKFLKWVDKVNTKLHSNIFDDRYYMILFIFYNTFSIVFSYDKSNNDYTIYLFEKCYEIIKSRSIRESFEILSTFYNSCKEYLFKLKLLDVKYEVDRLHTILYEI